MRYLDLIKKRNNFCFLKSYKAYKDIPISCCSELVTAKTLIPLLTYHICKFNKSERVK
jgi:hypothetical protein